MKEKRISVQEILMWDTSTFRMFQMCMKSKSYRLIGIMLNKCVKVSVDATNRDLVFNYE